MNITYRNFTLTDSNVLTDLILELYIEDPGTKDMTPEKIQNTLNILSEHTDRGTIMVIEKGENIIGYSILIKFWSNEFGGNIVIIDELFIKKEFRSQGIGAEFLRYLAKNKIFEAVALQLEVTENNLKARRLYKSLGFRLHKNHFYNLVL